MILLDMTKNSLNLDKIKMGMVVAFVSDGSFISKRIVAYQTYLGFDVQSAKITHVGISMGGEYIIESTFPRSTTSNLLKDHQGREIKFLYYRGESFRDRLRYHVALWCATRCNLPYGWQALLGFYLKSLIPLWSTNPLGVHRTPFCSYLLAWGFRRAGLDPWPGVSSDLVTPAHIVDSDRFEEVDVSSS